MRLAVSAPPGELRRWSGTLYAEFPQADVAALRNAGFSDQQVIEIISAISAILFTNMVNRVNDTVVDFPKAD